MLNFNEKQLDEIKECHSLNDVKRLVSDGKLNLSEKETAAVWGGLKALLGNFTTAATPVGEKTLANVAYAKSFSSKDLYSEANKYMRAM